jgi:hypothetical protein
MNKLKILDPVMGQESISEEPHRVAKLGGAQQ